MATARLTAPAGANCTGDCGSVPVDAAASVMIWRALLPPSSPAAGQLTAARGHSHGKVGIGTFPGLPAPGRSGRAAVGEMSWVRSFSPNSPTLAAGRREHPGTGPDDIGTADSGGADAVGGADDDLVQRLGNLPDADGCCTAVKQAFQHTQRQPPGPIAAARVSSSFISSSRPGPAPRSSADAPPPARQPGRGLRCAPLPRCSPAAGRPPWKSPGHLPPAAPAGTAPADKNNPAAHPVDALQPGGILRERRAWKPSGWFSKGFCQSRRPTFHT